jgi:hypothetical protein
MTGINNLSPCNEAHEVYMDGKHFKSPIHFLYYYAYDVDLSKAPTVDTLLALGVQLKEPKINMNEHIYTLIAYLYCTYEDFRLGIHKLRHEPRPKIDIINDTYLGFPTCKYARALKSFAQCLQM